MKKIILTCLGMLVFCAVTADGLRAAEPPPPSGPALATGQEPATLHFTAKSATFNRATGDILLEGDVVVTRTTGADVLTVKCNRMTGKMVEGKIEDIHAYGDVRIDTEAYNATASEATFEFAKNVVVLKGGDGKLASVHSAGMVSTGPTVIFDMESGSVNMPDGAEGSTVVEIKGPPGTKKNAPPTEPAKTSPR